MKNVEKVYNKLKDIENVLTSAILFHESKNSITFFDGKKTLEKINALKKIRFEVRMFMQTAEEIINNNRNRKLN